MKRIIVLLCPSCNRHFETPRGLAIHQHHAHGVITNPQRHGIDQRRKQRQRAAAQ